VVEMFYLTERNADKQAVWLAPDYHGQGIMPAVLKTLMAEVLIPYFNAHHLIGGYYEHNLASKKVFEKCGFTFWKSAPDVFTINPTKINGEEGRKVGVGLMTWERESSG